MYCVCLTARMAKEKEKETRGEATETRLTLQHETAVVLMAEKRRGGGGGGGVPAAAAACCRDHHGLSTAQKHTVTRGRQEDTQRHSDCRSSIRFWSQTHMLQI